ncbi:hypothetical protein [Caldibacillus debilis]|uniref:Uncharacterized protein n=1 Tax=Caldibacillus debilis GB1 TaxID=1339248 RepID=A0A420VEE2_9BACI|nr:hypothetical protein [Caldibacillus debilis]RKO61778.1 hypothetical protein Cdeb_01271 [Caldibacillus debilis GB1]
MKIYLTLYDKNGEGTIVSHTYNGELKNVGTHAEELAKGYLKDFDNIDEVRWEVVKIKDTGLLSRKQWEEKI